MIVAHDSEGFEAGQRNELDVVTNFIERRSQARNINDRLHVVWFVKLFEGGLHSMRIISDSPLAAASSRYCIEMNSRPIQQAEKEFFALLWQGSPSRHSSLR